MARIEPAVPKCLFIDVEHLFLGQLRARDERADHFRRGPRTIGEYGTVDFHAGRNGDHRHPIADGIRHIPRRTVAAGESDEFDAGLEHPACDCLGILRPRPLADGTNDFKSQAG